MRSSFKWNIVILFLSIFSLIHLQKSLAQELKINEILGSNSKVLADEDGDFSDWIEIYNSGTAPVDLAGYGLTDNEGNLYKWVFPEVTIGPGEYLIIWASGKDKWNGTSLHSNFRISAAGETLSLTSQDEVIIDEIPAVYLPANISYGRAPDGSEEFVYFTIPTPGEQNHRSGYSEIAATPEFSHEGGFYATPFTLSITSSDPSASIVYTIDGSDPDPDNLSGTTYSYKNQYPKEAGDPYGDLLQNTFTSYLYSDPIYIDDRSDEDDKLTKISSTFDKDPWYMPENPVYKGTVVKARVVKSGALPGEVMTNSYFIDTETYERYTIPVISLSIQEDALFDYEKGIYVAGKDFDDWRSTNRSEGADGGKPANYHRSGVEWEYPAHIEIFEGSKGRVLSQGIGIRIHGGWSTSFPAKSIRLYAKNQYGASQMDYSFFPEKSLSTYKRIILRNSGNDWFYTMFRDAAIQSIVGHMNFETMAYQPAVLFINSEYWGIHNFRERFDKYYFESNFDVDPENLDILEGNMVPVEGDASHYDETINYIKDNGLASNDHYDHIKSRIDINSFIDYQIAQIFIGNTDWPGNNIKFWRLRTNQYDASAPAGHDGRWRWMLYDTDFGLGINNSNGYNENTLSFAAEPNGPEWPNPPWSTFLFREFIKNESFRNDFINRFSDQLNTAFQPAIMKNKINSIKNLVELEIEEHIRRWKVPSSHARWINRVEVMLNYADKRAEHQRNHLKQFFKLGNEYNIKVDISHPNHGYVKINSLDLRLETTGIPEKVYPWTGSYFGGIPVNLEAVPAPGFSFQGWRGASGSTSKEIVLHPASDVNITAMFVSEVPHLIHYWNFNDEEKFFDPTFTFSQAKIDLKKGENDLTEVITDDGNGFKGENAQLNNIAGNHLRVNSPLSSELDFSLPTSGYSEIKLKFEARRSGQGAGILIIEYTLDGMAFIEKERISIPDADPLLYTVDFSSIELANHNELFGVKFKFEQGDGGQAGNNRFDNITLEGTPDDPLLSVKQGGKNEISIEAFPNPFDHEATIRINVPDQNKVKIMVQNLNGKVCQEIQYALNPGISEINLELNDQPGGVYLIHFQFQNFKAVYKLIKF